MKIRLSSCVWIVVTLVLSSVVAVELYSLLVVHLQVLGGWAEYQEDLYKELRATACAAKESCTVAELINSLNAVNCRSLEAETISYFPDWSQKQYKIRHNGSFALADWTFYDIDPILNYRGILKIARIDGVVEAVRMEYVYCEEE